MGTRAAALVVVVAFAILMMAGVSTALGATVPYDGSECTECHSSGGGAVDPTFSVPAVDYNTACAKCHWEPAGAHPYHNVTWNCGSCHPGMSFVDPSAVPLVSTSNGYFNTAASANAPSWYLHSVHAAGSWPADVTKNGRQCGSCHAPAACNVCHTGIDAKHTEHAYLESGSDYWLYGPDGTRYGAGTTPGNELENSVTNALTCSNDTCHPAPEDNMARHLVENRDASVVYTGSWGRSGTSGYTANSYSIAIAAGARSTLTFNGEKVDVISDLHPYRGNARIWIDGVATATVDLYAASTQKQVVVWESGQLTPGEHTVAVEVLGTKNAASKAAYVVVDAFRLYPTTRMPKQDCLICHEPDTHTGQDVFRSTDHGEPAAPAHTATATAWTSVTTTSTIRANVACESLCHTPRLGAEHASVIPSTSPATINDGRFTCAECHATAEYTANGGGTPGYQWTGDCSTCHVRHDAIVPKHNWTATSAGCAGTGCHEIARIDRIHYNATATIAPAGAVDNCNVCHLDDGKPKGMLNGGAPATDCEDCHVGGSHHQPITAASNECLSCHDGFATDTYAATGHPTCATCHNNPTYGDVSDAGLNDCTECHAAGGELATKDYSPHDPEHYVGTESTHTADGVESGIANAGGKTCVTCHRLEMKPEHYKSSTDTSTMAAYATTCIGCHELEVDGLGGWGNDCQECHATSTIHPAGGYSADHDFTTGNVACAGADCHDLSDVTAIHAASGPGAGDCTSCHDTNTAVPTESLCSDCHGNHAGSAHLSLQTECTDCHTDKADISSGHASCATCHSNSVLTDYLQDNYTAQCTDCHNNSNDWDGGGSFTPYTYTPADANHYNPYLTNHTAVPFTAAYQGAGGDGTAPAGGKECNTCHAGQLKPAHLFTSTSGGSVSCVECHTDTSLNSSATVAANWSNDKCKDCHDTGAATTHDSYVTSHTVSTTRGCAGSGSGCHGTETNLATLHDADQQGGSPNYNSCYNSDTGENCHTNMNRVPTKVWTGTDSCGSGSGGCHTEKTTSNHGADHNYTAASAYSQGASPDSETGCAASGTGCHPSASTGDAVTTFHASSGCMSGACHASATMDQTWKDGGSGANCSRCHGDTVFAGAEDMIALSDPRTVGHYGESTHTPTSMASTVSAGGTYTATCSTCHDATDAGGIDGLYYQHSGLATAQVSAAANANLSCSECHNRNAAITAEVTGKDWDDTCADCHNGTDLPGYAQHGTTAPSVAGTESAGAGSCQTSGCHTTTDLHALHKSNATGNPNGCTMSGCHDATKQGWKPTATSCGSGGDCHTGAVHPGEAAAHTTLSSSECVNCHESGDLKTVHSNDCGTCHGNATYPTLPTGKLECTSCHTSGVVANLRAGSGGNYTYHDPTHYVGTESTHTADGVESGISNTGGKACVTCHALELKPEHYKSSTDTSTMAAYATTCVGCHELEVDGLGGWGNDCQECHATATVHPAAGYSADHDFTTGNAGCAGGNCHDTSNVTAIHAPALPGAGDCTSCHDTNAAVPTESLCTDCHAAHASVGTAHTSSQTACTDCHKTFVDIRTGHTSCATCHSDARLTDYLNDNYTATCTDCHSTGGLGGDYSPPDPDHATGNEATHTASPFTAAYQGVGGDGPVAAGGKECNTCHSSTLKNAHASTSTNGGSVTCVECHTDTSLNSSATVAANWSNDKCKDCHDFGAAVTHDAYNTAHTASTTRGCAGSGSGCHGTTTNLATLHDTSQSGGSPTYSSCSNSDTGENCHVSSNTRPTKVWTGTDSCGSGSAGCHTEKTTSNHGIQHELTANASDYNDGATTGCLDAGAGCHGAESSNDIATYHPDSGCTSGPCHTSADKASASQPFLCTDCHDGTFQNATDTVGVGQYWPVGHFKETSHTAGTAQANSTTYYSTACVTCHYMQVSLEHTKTTSAGATTCGGCHQDSDAIPQVTGRWPAQNTTGACGACHGTGAIPAAHSGNFTTLHTATSTGCSTSGVGCHNTANIATVTGLHSACTRCHGQTYDPTKKTCGNTRACHNSSYNTSTLVHNGTGGLADGNDPTHHTATLTAGQYTGADAVDSDSVACSTCHTGTMTTAHTNTRVGSVTCSGCHNSSVVATSPLVVKASWPTKKCTACHNAGATAHASIETSHNFTGTGCASSGAGCHSTANVRTLHAAKGCAITGCHGVDKKMNTATKTCGSVSGGCHNTFTSTNHGGTTGNDTTHTASTSYMQTKVDGVGARQLDCTGCHISTLGSEHTTVGAVTYGTSITCTECHNNAGSTGAPNSSVTVIKPGPWNDQCSACHTATRVSGHATTTPGPHAVNDSTQTVAAGGAWCNSCHAGFAANVSVGHSEATTLVASITYNTCNVCHRGSADTSLTVLYSKGAAWDCVDCHPGKRSTHGGSSGGQKCNNSGCHTASAYTDMVNNTSTYHHVLDAADPWLAPASGSYPTSKTAMACVSCHVDHSEYKALPGGSGKAFSLRNSAVAANPSAANTDDTLCLSCHDVNLARSTTGQKSNIITETMVWDIPVSYWTGSVGATSPHNYTVDGAFNDSSIFRANCAKCHGTLGGTVSSGKFAVHSAAEQRIINALGDTIDTTSIVNEEQMCFRCHSVQADFVAYGGSMPGTAKPGDYTDWYGGSHMDTSNVAIYVQMHAGTNTYGHKPHEYQNIHLLDEVDEDQAYISANKHVECADCHNHHAVGNARHEWGTTNQVSEALRGVTGASFNTNNLSTVNRPSQAQVNAEIGWKSEATYEYEICFKCHSSANTNYLAWGAQEDAADGNARGANRWTNVAIDFNVGNQSRHPALAALPVNDPSTSYGSSRVFAGQLLDIWAPGDTMYCSDCHGDSTAPLYSDPASLDHAQGPHGSSVRFSLRGPRTSWPIRNSDGQPYTISMVEAEIAGSGSDLFCLNCHPNVGGNKVHTNNSNHKVVPCYSCHVLVPHGSGMSRLLGDGDGTGMPARLAWNNNKANMYVASFTKKADPSTYQRKDCQVTAASGCGSHTQGSNGSMENW